MSTRGIYGFRKNNTDKITYNHYDSYPSGLGNVILRFIQGTTLESLNFICDKTVLVSFTDKPTKEQFINYKRMANVFGRLYSEQYFHGFKESPYDWGTLLSPLEGRPDALMDIAEHCPEIYMPDSGSFIKESLHCEYGYIINLDTNRLEFWRGFQKEPDENNRYGTDAYSFVFSGEERKYYPCKLCFEIPLEKIFGCSNLKLKGHLIDLNHSK